MSTTVHCSLDVENSLRTFKAQNWKRSMKDETGRRLTPAECKDFLLSQLKLGRTCIPIGEPCEGFSYETGCPGHEAADPIIEACGPPVTTENPDGSYTHTFTPREANS